VNPKRLKKMNKQAKPRRKEEGRVFGEGGHALAGSPPMSERNGLDNKGFNQGTIANRKSDRKWSGRE